MCAYIHVGEADENLHAGRMMQMCCFVDSCLDSTVFGRPVVDKPVRHRLLECHNLLYTNPAEIGSIDDIRARRVEPMGDKDDLKDRYRGCCRRSHGNAWGTGMTTRPLAKYERWWCRYLGDK